MKQSRAEELAKAWEARARALDRLLVYYRTGTRPPERVLDELTRTRTALRNLGAKP